MTHTLGPIHSESVIVIIGGGPAGSACALKLQQLAEKNQIHPRIILYEGKRFEKKSYYNQCIGVLSPPLQDILEKDLGIPFPWNLVLRTINGYEVHSENKSLHLSGTHDPSYASRRVEFDNYLFQWAQQRGIETFATRVTDLELHPDGVMVFSESNNIKADVVVGAFGLDDGMAKAFFGDRYVMVGDASGLIRPFKGKGINAAVITGIKAAEAMIQEGISKASFYHYLDNCHELTRDILPGKIMRYLTKTASRLGLLDSALEVAKSDPPMQKAIFNVVSAQETYQKTWKDAGGFPFLFRIGMKTLRQKLFPAKT